MRYDINYADSDWGDSPLPPQLFAGDTPAVVTNDHPITNVAIWPQYRVLQRNASTQAWELWAAGGLPVAGVVAYDLPIGTAKRAAIYEAGMFNIDALVWPNGTTEAQAQAGLRDLVKGRKLLYSDKRTGNEQLGVPAGPSLLTINPQSGALANVPEDVAMPSVQLQALNASEGAVEYVLYSGTLPAGTTISATGLYAGTPTTQGTYTFAVKATDSAGKVGVVHYTHTITA